MYMCIIKIDQRQFVRQIPVILMLLFNYDKHYRQWSSL